jgi:hypothetical protein
MCRRCPRTAAGKISRAQVRNQIMSELERQTRDARGGDLAVW